MSLKEKIRREKRKTKILTGSIISVVVILLALVIGMLFLKDDSDSEVGVKSEPKDSIEIETKYCSLYYPAKWKDFIDIKVSEDAGYKVEFYGTVTGKGEIHLFDICFNSDDGVLLGYFDREEAVNVSFDIIEVNFDKGWIQEEMDQIYSMQEDVNYVIEKLELEKDYVNPEQ